MHKYLTPIFVVPLLAIAAIASAETLSSPATNCVSTTGSFYWDGEVSNGTTSVANVNCPVMTSSAAPLVKLAKAVFIDRNNGQNVRCIATTQWIAADGVVYWYESAPMESSGFGSAPQSREVAVNFGALGQNFQFQCQIPPRGPNGNSSLFRHEITR